MIYNTYLYQGNWSTDDMCFLKEIVLKFLSSIHHKTRSWKRRVLLAGCKVLTNGRRLKSSPFIFYEKRSLRFIASGLQTSREVWVFEIYMVISPWQRNVLQLRVKQKKDVWINFMTDDNHVFGSLRSNQNARKILKRKYVLKQNVFC